MSEIIAAPREGDLRLLRLCAEAIGYRHYTSRAGVLFAKDYYPEQVNPRDAPYDPLAYDEQAMRLVKKFNLVIGRIRTSSGNPWTATRYDTAGHQGVSDDLNRAIVECVAQMQEAKKK